MQSNQIQVGAKARRVVEVLEDTFARSWIYARHLALLCDCFVQFGYYKPTKYFGTYRIELIVALFDRILDIHNFEFVVKQNIYIYIYNYYFVLFHLFFICFSFVLVGSLISL